MGIVRDSMGTLVMLHGLTGTPEMIRPLAETLCPPGWDILLPEGPFKHPERGSGWWIRDAPPETPLDGNTPSLKSMKVWPHLFLKCPKVH